MKPPTTDPASLKTTCMPVEGEYVRVHRLLRIMTLIQSQNGWDAKALARECHVGQRTIFRDMEMLEGAGIPYFFDEEHGGYRIRGDFFMRPIELTIEEALAIVALGEHIAGPTHQVSFLQPAARAVAKIRSQLPDRMQKELEKLSQHLAIRIGQTAIEDEAEDVFLTLQRGVAEHRCVECLYDSVSGGEAKGKFILQPYTLLFSRRAWYVIGHHGRYDEVRCLKVSRFLGARVTDKQFTPPKAFSLSKYLGNAWWMIRGDIRYRVELRFDQEFADNIAATHWHKTQEVDWHDDGSITFRCKVDGLDEIVWWVLSMGPHCTVVQPKELVARVCQLSEQTLQRYRKP